MDRSYPTYEEWKLNNFGKYGNLVSYVLILPMRNGNASFLQTTFASSLSSYPTYEEWKRVIFVPAEYTCPKVLILPMRNGNRRRCKTM